MTNVTLLVTCKNCPGTLALKAAAIDAGYNVNVELVRGTDERTVQSVLFGIGLPVLIREDGSMSDDAKEWQGEPEKRSRKKVTNPVEEYVEPAEDVEDADTDKS